MGIHRQQLSVNLKVRVTPDDDTALERLAGKKRQSKAQLARTAIAEFIDREHPALELAAASISAEEGK